MTQRKRGRAVRQRLAKASKGQPCAGSIPAASAPFYGVDISREPARLPGLSFADISIDGELGELAKPAVLKTAEPETASEFESQALRQTESSKVLDAAREMQPKLSRGENAAKKRRKYSVEKYLSHPQFCRLGSVSNFDKKAFDENFEKIFGAKPPAPDYGERDGYVVKRYEGKHEAVIVGGEGLTKEQRAELKKRRRERLRKADL